MADNSSLDIAANRRHRNWTAREHFGRAVWSVVYPMFWVSPRPLWAWRRWLLRIFGASIGKHVQVHPTARIAVPWNLTIGDYSSVGDGANLYSLGRIDIGERVTVSQGAHLCAGTHDWRDPAMSLLKLPIVIEDECWICSDAFIGPNVKIGRRSIVGARAVAMKDIPPSTLVAGNPARKIGEVDR